jgi:formylglycine-generating enzyme required for sulfatase activity
VHALTAAQDQALKPGDSFNECTNCPEMIVVPVGSFLMGSSEDYDVGEHPQHSVTIATRFAVAKFELTFAEWDACVADRGCNGVMPSDQGWGRGRRPVINVNWYEAQAYVAWLAKLTRKPYRLLSEAEYEYATRAGTTTAYPWGSGIKLNGQAMANCGDCGSKWDGKQTAPVGSFPPNKFGLYDMVGNVWEWTEDCAHIDAANGDYSGAPTDGSAWITGGDCDIREVRGGSWKEYPLNLRSEERDEELADVRRSEFGFRVGRTLIVP